VLFKLLLVSFAMMVTLYLPMAFGMVKLLLNVIVAPSWSKVSSVELALGKVMLARTIFTAILSVTLADICIVSEMLKVLFASGVRFLTSGRVISNTVKLVVSVLLTFPEVSFAMIVTLYTPGASVSVVGKVALKISPTKFVMVSNKKDPSARVTFASTVSKPMLSVTLTVMLVLCVWLKNRGSAVRLMTVGGVLSSTVKLVVSVLFVLPEVSFAMMVRLYSPIGAVSPGTKEKLKMSPASNVIVRTTLLPSALVMLARTVSRGPLSVTFAVMLVMSV